MSIIDLIFPKKCFGCGINGKYFCENCQRKPILSKQICIECLRPSVDGKTHFGCQKKHSLDGFVSVYKYQGAIKKALVSLKYRFAYDTADELTKIVVTQMQKLSFLFSDSSTIIPIPLYKNRKNWRGFNQSEIVGKKLAKIMRYNYDDTSLVRLIDHTPQAKLHKTERLKNVKNIYKVVHSEEVDGRNIILLDDVVTTGATLREAGKILKQSGAKTVWGIAIAH